MARGVLGILMLLTYGIWDFVFERKLTWAERYTTVCVKILSRMVYPFTRHSGPFDAHLGSLHRRVGFPSNVSIK